jgi:hypothetical protein
MTERPKRPRDANQLAKFIVDVATGEDGVDSGADARSEQARNAGLIGGKARSTKLSSEKKLEIARAAARARWGHGDDTTSS